jgi:predicted SprT family Zn-dependent metalloprotease
MSNFIPRGWKQNSNKQLQEIYDECCAKAIELKLLDYTPKLYIFKSTRTWGWARYPDKHQKSMGYKSYIGLNEVYLKDPTKAVNTICHELAHIASPSGTGHGLVWKRNFENLGSSFGLNRFERCSSSEYVGLDMPKQYKYEAYCPKCGNIWKKQKRTSVIQRPHLYYCPTCKQSLKSRVIK